MSQVIDKFEQKNKKGSTFYETHTMFGILFDTVSIVLNRMHFLKKGLNMFLELECSLIIKPVIDFCKQIIFLEQ